MSQSIESQSWYRVAHLKPRLADRIEVSRQMFRDAPWYVLRDPMSGKFSRVTESTYWVIAQMDGSVALGALWDAACTELGDGAPTQDELLSVVAQLNSADILSADNVPDIKRLVGRGTRLRRKTMLARFLNPLAMRFPLFDPDAIITELWPIVRPLLTVWGGIAYLALIISGVVTAARHWDELTTDVFDRVMAAESLLIILFVYPFVKLIHEFGHGFAIKKWGGEVREIGVMFLVFLPVPYVDGTASTAFASKWARMLVSGAGILVEMGLAAGAMLLWTELEPGILRAVCFNIMVIGGVSTVIFNGNPLLRFDGYFVLSDWLEIPNLGSRSNRYLGYLIQRYLFGVTSARSPVRARGEAQWFFSYSIAAFCYRIVISLTIIVLVASRFFAVGVLLAAWSITLMFFLPVVKHLRFVASSEVLRGRRGRAWIVSLAGIAGLVGLIGFVPLPYRTVAEGIVYAPEEATIYVRELGQVDALLASPGQQVAEGTPILRMSDPLAQTGLAAAQADAEKFSRRYEQSLSEGAYETRLWKAQAARAESEAEILRERIDALNVRSPRHGVFIVSKSADLEGQFLQKGDVVGYVVRPEDFVVRIAVSQNVADLIRSRHDDIELRSAEKINTIIGAKLIREVPEVGYELPSAALSTQGGGKFSLDPAGRDAPTSIEPIMVFDLAPLGPPPSLALGMRVYVRFDHGAEPFAKRVYRSIRQVFLRRLNV